MLSKSSMKVTRFYLLMFIAFAVLSCKRPDEFPIIPVISFKSISISKDTLGFDNKITLLLNFTDGDGDVGYYDNGQNDSIFDNPKSPYYDNYIVTYFLLKDGVWVSDALPIIPPLLQPGGRLPYLTPKGKNKSLKGEITCYIDPPVGAINNTFRMDIFIYDRSLHKSNIITTPDFILTTHPF